MDSNQRLILTVVLCVGIVLAFELLAPKKEAPPPEANAPAQQAPAAAPSPAPAPGAIPPPSPAPAAPAPGAPVPAGPEEQVTLQTPAMEVVLGSRDGSVLQARLLGEKGRRQGTTEAVDLAQGLPGATERLFAVRLGAGLAPPGPCQVQAKNTEAATFLCEGPGYRLTKQYRVKAPNRVGLDVTLTNLGQTPLAGAFSLVMPAAVDPSRQHRAGCSLGSCGMMSAPAQPTYVVCRHDDSVTRVIYDADKRSQALEGAARFAGVEERYFLAAAVPLGAATCQLDTPTPELSQALLTPQLNPMPPGTSSGASFALVVGPKDTQFLASESSAIATSAQVPDPRLDTAVDLGFFGAIARVLLSLLRIFHGLIPNWGVAIILLTLFVKVLTFPLAWKAMKSMEEVRKLAPEMDALKKKYPDDREKQQLEMMQLYQKHKVNPLGGCLPMLIQMPIWLALYTVLQTSVELYNEPFIGGWINDLTSKDPYYILPLAMGVTMFMTQKMQPAQMDPAQQKMMLYFMPIFFTFIMLQLPAGLTLYIFTNNVLSIAQQLLLRRSMGVPMVGGPGGSGSAASKTTLDVTPERSKGKKKDGK